MAKRTIKKTASALMAVFLCAVLLGSSVTSVFADAMTEPAAYEKESAEILEEIVVELPEEVTEEEPTASAEEASAEEKPVEEETAEEESAGEEPVEEESAEEDPAEDEPAEEESAGEKSAVEESAEGESVEEESGTEGSVEEKTAEEESIGEEPVSEEILDKIIFPEEGDEYLGQLIVVFEDGTTADVVTEIVENTEQVELQDEEDAEKVEEALSVVPVEITEDATYEEAAIEVAKNDEVLYVQPNFLYTALEDSYEDIGTSEPQLTGGANWHLAAVHAPAAWALQKTNGAVEVAVLDTGCDLSHEDLSANLDKNYAFQAVEVNENNDKLTSGTSTYIFTHRTPGKLTASWGTRGDISASAHGTHVCGIVSAVPNNGKGVAGISYNAKVLPINVFDTAYDEADTKKTLKVYSTTEFVTSAYNYLINKRKNGELSSLRVINLSLGGYDKKSREDQAIQNAITTMNDEYNIVTVCAAGNSGSSDISYPSDFEKCVSVCAIDKEGWKNSPLRWYGSDYNEYKDISAPGDYIYSTSISNEYSNIDGTSAAAPCVSGVFALIFAAKPSLTADAAKQILYDTATDITGSANKGSATCAKGWDMYTGYGLVNAEAAVRKAKGMSVSQHAKIVSGGIYTIHSALKNSMVLDINGASVANKGNLQLYSSNGTNAQKFVFVQNSDKTWKIYSYRSGLVLDVSGNGKTNGTNVQQYEDNGTTAQKWDLQYNADGTITIIGVSSKLVLDISGAKTANKTNAQIYKSNNTNAQRFKLEKVGTIPVLPGTYTLEASQNRNFVVDVKSASTANSANIQLYSKNGTKAQNFTFVIYRDGYYEIKTFSGKAVDVSGAKTANLTNIQQYALNHTNAQQWAVIKNSDGTFTFKSRCAGKVMDVRGNSMKNGSNISIYTSNGTKAQKFYMVRK